MAVTAGALSKVLVGQTVANLSSAAATGGTGPYTYQWYRSTTSGFTPGAGNLISGATALSLADSGLIPGTTYYYEVIATDTGAGNATSDSSQLTVIMDPGQQPNQFSQSSVVGVVDMRVGPTNVMAAQIDASVANLAAPYNIVYPGQAVKIVAHNGGGILQIQPCSANSDDCIGFVKWNFKDIQYTAGQNCEICLWGTVVWLVSTSAITQMARACLDVTVVGGVQATGNSSVVMGWAIDGAAAAGSLIRVMLLENAAFATA